MGEIVLRLASVPLAPLAYWQGRRVRASIGPPSGAAGDPFGRALPQGASSRAAVRLLVVGESTVAGCGIAQQRDALAAHVAAALAARAQAPVDWHAVGRIGITARRVVSELDGDIAAVARVDLAVVALGVNDVLTQSSARAFAVDLADVIAMVRRHHTAVPVVLAGVPPVGAFPALPQPLRALLGWRAWWLDRSAAQVAARLDRVTYVPTRLDREARELFAPDGFHPSSDGCRVWAAALVEAGARELGPDRAPSSIT